MDARNTAKHHGKVTGYHYILIVFEYCVAIFPVKRFDRYPAKGAINVGLSQQTPG